MRTTIRNLMAADGTLQTLLTGGVYAEREIKRKHAVTDAAFDANGLIQPCALVKATSEFADGPDQFAGRQYIDIYFYELDGFVNIDQAIDRTKILLHRQKIGVPADGVWEVRWFHNITDTEDPALLCSLSVSRYEVIRYRG